MNENLIGQELEAYCSKCKDDTLHSITAATGDKIDKVLCKICMSYHKYKAPASAAKEPAPKKKKAATTKTKTVRTRRSKAKLILDEAVIGDATEYKITKNYEMDGLSLIC